MKVIHIIWSLQSGGMENMLVDILNEQIKNNKIYLIIINDNINEDLLNNISDRVKIIAVKRSKKVTDIFKIIYLNLVILLLKPDVVHCHQDSLIRLFYFIKKITPIRFVITIHDVGINLNSIHNYQKVFSISHAVAKDIYNRYRIKSEVILNGIKLSEIKKKSDYKFNTFKIIQISSLNHRKKGQDLLIKAIAEIKKNNKLFNIMVYFVGKGTSLNYLENLARSLGVANQCNFLGQKDRKFIYSTLCNYNLLVQPSRYEGFGLTIVEGMAAKIPVLVSNIEGPIEIIKNGKYGYWFKNNDYNDLREKITGIIHGYGKNEIKKKTEEAYIYASNQFDITKTVESYLKIY